MKLWKVMVRVLKTRCLICCSKPHHLQEDALLSTDDWWLWKLNVTYSVLCSPKWRKKKTKKVTATATQKLSLSSTSFGHQENSGILFFPGWRWETQNKARNLPVFNKSFVLTSYESSLRLLKWVNNLPDAFQKANWAVKKYSACLDEYRGWSTTHLYRYD